MAAVRPRVLVVNADDAGVDAARNRGILRAARAGAVRSASLLVGFPAAADFVAGGREVPGLAIGLHANFTEGTPLVRGHRTLAGPDGRFLGKAELLRRAEAGFVDPREARRELLAQLEACRALGFEPSHVDGHNHAHLFPGIAEALLETLPERFWVRVPLDAPAPAPLRHVPGLAARALALGFAKFRRADRVIGLDLMEGYAADDVVTRLGEGVTELVVHPGEVDAASVPFSASPARAREVEALCALPARLSDVRIASFREA